MSLQARRTNSSEASDGPAKKPSVPRPSASLLLVNKNDEVLMIQRTLATKNFAGMHAFPGGNFDPQQDADFQMTALREMFEETGILLVEPPINASYPTAEELAAARLAIHSRTDPLTFPDFLARSNLKAPVDKLVPFSQWITPENVAVRFHARFYVLFIEELEGGVVKVKQASTQGDGMPISKEADVLVQNPMADGGVEIISASWIHPRELFAAFRRGQVTLMPPQYYLLTILEELFDAMYQGGHRTQVLRSCIGGFGSRVFNPRPGGFTEEGGKGKRSILTYEGDELRGGKAGDRHRSLILNQGGRIADIELQRNIEVFTPLHSLDSKAKL